ncbi:tetratricopeptide repeat protein [Yinghuangia sp. YIM S09857]|uniref:tetratricopeptide repeat protein n=1 Tax=Yinghuangia sp. YIM S09857 TaxID=3436929 RepID=UPI003F5309B0
MAETENSISGGRFTAPVVQARVANFHIVQPERSAQRQLQGSFRHFVNRVAEFEALGAALPPSTGPTVVVLTGMGGVGKTATALRWLMDVQDRYPGDHLSIDLRGQEPDASLAPTVVLDRFLRDLGVPAPEIPGDVARLPERFRSLTSGQPVIVFLDNARTAAQVRPLMPGHPDSLVVVTSRYALTGLVASHGAISIPVRPLDEGDAAELLTAMTGQTAAASLAARACGGLPIALRVLGAQVVGQVHASLGDAAVALDGGGGASGPDWEVLEVPDDELSVRAVFDASYRSLDATARVLYRGVGLHPTPAFDVRAAAAASDLPTSVVRTGLAALVRASLLERDSGTELFRMHDLVHAHARDQAAAAPAAECDAAVDRIVGDYLRRAVDGDRAVSGRWRHGPAFATAAESPYPDAASALDALERDRDNLVSAVRLAARTGRCDVAWQLCEALWGLFFMRRHFADWIETYQLGVEAASAADERVAEARLRLHLAFAHFERNAGPDDEHQARTGFDVALRLAQEAAHSRTVSSAYESLGLLALRTGDPARAARDFGDAYRAIEGIDHPRGRALLAHHRGRALAQSGQDAEAVPQLAAAREAFASLGDPYNEARVATSLGEAHLGAGRPEHALAVLADALPHMTQNKIRHEEARILHLLGNAHAARGAADEAHAAWSRAADTYDEIGDPRADEVRAALTPPEPPR